MSETKKRGPIGRLFHHMGANPLIWAAAGAVVGLICLFVRNSAANPSLWGDVMAFAFMFSGIMIVLYGDRYGSELPMTQPQESSNV
ncbi:hypothetical protein IAI18_21285 [Acetobacteraceae bacterium H6797]|nr:hypothetical protein [Acetobacteraceae bacterium H6797]